jgi:hypothetical protein
MSIGEKQKEKIVEIALDVNDETNKYKSMYLNNLQGETFSEPSPFEETK